MFIRLTLFLIIFFCAMGATEGIEKQKLLTRLKERKKDFDLYFKRHQKKQIIKDSIVEKQKELRRKTHLERERARKQFKRRGQIFPEKAYRNFFSSRQMKKEKMEKERRLFKKIKEEIKKIKENRKYRIDGEKEFDLSD